MRIKYGERLLIFAEDGWRDLFWNFPGAQKKAWCRTLYRSTLDENAYPTGHSPIFNIVARRDVRQEDEYVTMFFNFQHLNTHCLRIYDS